MDLEWTDEQRALRDEVVRVATAELNRDLVRRDRQSEFSPEAWKACAALGIQGLPVPEEWGGSGADPPTVALALEALGYGCRDNGLIFSVNAQMWSCELPLVTFGTDEQRRRYLPGLCDGSRVGVQAMTEPDSGSDAYAMATTATRSAGGWALNGVKTFITNAPIADLFVVFARTAAERTIGSISAFLVERDAPGLTVGPPFEKMGLRTSPMAEVVLRDCRVPEKSLLGPMGGGLAAFTTSMDWERSFILASAVGTMQRQLERCVAYASERRQFGQPIGKFQAVSHRIAEMRIRLETARLLLHQQALRKARGLSTPADAAMVKAHLSDCFLRSSLDALQIHGGYGYMVDAELERDVRDAIAGHIYSGTSEIQRNIIAAYLGL